MSKPMILGLVALGGFVVLGAGLYQLGGKTDSGKDLPLQATGDKPKSGKVEEKTPASKRTDHQARDRKPIERKGRDSDRPASDKKAGSAGSNVGADSEKPAAPAREALGKLVSNPESTHSAPSADDFSPSTMPKTESDAAIPGASKATGDASGPPAEPVSQEERLSTLLSSAQPQADDPAASRKAGTESSEAGTAQDSTVETKQRADTKESGNSLADAAGTKSYRVSRGDTLALISEIHYGSQKHVDRILAANPQIKDPDKVIVGMELRIPPLAAPLPSKSDAQKEKDVHAGATSKSTESKTGKEKTAEESYVVQDGDTLYSIAERFYGDGSKWQEIFDFNKADIGDEPSQLKMGQKIKLPGTPKKSAEPSKAN